MVKIVPFVLAVFYHNLEKTKTKLISQVQALPWATHPPLQVEATLLLNHLSFPWQHVLGSVCFWRVCVTCPWVWGTCFPRQGTCWGLVGCDSTVFTLTLQHFLKPKDLPEKGTATLMRWILITWEKLVLRKVSWVWWPKEMFSLRVYFYFVYKFICIIFFRLHI